MTIATAGLGPSNTLVTRGLGAYQVIIIPVDGSDTGAGGSKPQFYVAPRRIWVRTRAGEPTLRLADIEPKVIEQALESVTEMIIDGEPYLVTGGIEPTSKEALAMIPKLELDLKVRRVQYELGVTKKQAIKALEARAAKEITAAREFRMELVKDEEEFILIIIMSEV